MKHFLFLTFTFCFSDLFVPQTCNSQIAGQSEVYCSCEPRATTDPSRLNIRASARDYGMIPPCTGSIELYISPNSRTRSLVLHLEYWNMDDKRIHLERIRADLEPLSTGMLQKEIIADPVEGEFCRTLQIAIRSMKCYSADGSVVDCPDIRIILSNAFHSLLVVDKLLNVCNAKL
jgi:hypothetical protein